MNLISQFAADVVQSPKGTAGVVVVTTNLGILAILEKGAGLVVVMLSIIVTLLLIRTHFLKMKILQNELDEIKSKKELKNEN